MTGIEEIIRQMESGSISRRSFVKKMVALGLSLPAINMLMAVGGPGAAAATPKKGGQIKAAFLMASAAEGLDPAKFKKPLDYTRGYQLYNNLVSIDSKLLPQPELAESWEPNADASEWTFKLRKGIKFHNGKAFTAKDVIYTMARVKDPKTGSPGKPYLDSVVDMKADGDHVLKIKLAEPSVDFPVIMAEYRLLIVADGHTDFDKPNGTGAFTLKEFKPGMHMIAIRNPDYWKDGLPYVDQVETFSIPDPVARTSALMTGEVHLVEDIDLKMYSKVNDNPNISLEMVPSGAHGPMSMITTAGVYKDPNVRLALKYLVDREKHIKIAHQGFGIPGNDHPISPVDPMYCDELPIRQYDPDKAKFLLKKAGLENHTFELITSDGLGEASVNDAVVFKESAAKAGVDVKVTRAPGDGYWEAVWMKKPFCVSAWLMRPTANMILSLVYKSDAPWNETFWKRPDFDKLLLEARRTVDIKKRKELFCAMQTMISDDGGVIVPCFQKFPDAKLARVKGVPTHPMGAMDAYRFAEKAWLA